MFSMFSMGINFNDIFNLNDMDVTWYLTKLCKNWRNYTLKVDVTGYVIFREISVGL